MLPLPCGDGKVSYSAARRSVAVPLPFVRTFVAGIRFLPHERWHGMKGDQRQTLGLDDNLSSQTEVIGPFGQNPVDIWSDSPLRHHALLRQQQHVTAGTKIKECERYHAPVGANDETTIETWSCEQHIEC